MSLVNDEGNKDFASCFTFDNLMNAAKRCMSGSSWKYKAQAFDLHRVTECRKLQLQLENKTYKLSKAEKFIVNERGKLRVVRSVAFRDRVVQKCFCDFVFADTILHAVVDETSAALRGRGTTHAFNHVKEIVSNAEYNSYVVQYDFANYFHSIDHELLLGKLYGLIDNSFNWLLRDIVCSNEQGLELGSAVNQLCATFYPTDLDNDIMSINGVIGYHRYMDDGVIVCKDKVTAKTVYDRLFADAKLLKLNLSERKTYINKLNSPFVFCKMRYTKFPDGNVKMNVRKEQTHRALRHYRNVCKRSKKFTIDTDAALGSLAGYVNHGDSDLTHLVKRIYRETH